MLEFIASGDHRLMRRVHRWRAPRWIRLWMVYATRGGDGWLWYATAVFLLFFGGPVRFRAIAAEATASTAATLLFMAIKRKAKRRRPGAMEPHCWATLLPPDQFSFPSGHSMTAFAVAVSLMAFYPSMAGGLLFCAISVGLSRIVLGMHFLSDVVAGAGIGALLGYTAAALVR